MGYQLAEFFHVFALDQRNHGHSGHAPEMSYPLMAEDLNEFLRSQGLEWTHVLGHSMGGKTAMQFALSFPRRVRKLLVADIAPRLYPPFHEQILSALLALDLETYTTRKQIEDALSPAIPELSTRQFLLKNLERDSNGRFRWKIGLAEISQSYECLRQGLSADAPFDGPALFVRGETSAYLTQNDHPAIRRLFSRARLITIPDAGHLLHVENPSAFLKETLEFLRMPGAEID